MKFYQVDLRNDYGSSAGFEYFTSKRDAVKAFNDWFDCGEDKSVEEEFTEERMATKINVIEVTPTKAGILKALRRYASHADNG
jgi:hypothetical protein